VLDVHRIAALGHMVGVTDYVGDHVNNRIAPTISTFFHYEVSDLWQCAELKECFHCVSFVTGSHMVLNVFMFR